MARMNYYSNNNVVNNSSKEDSPVTNLNVNQNKMLELGKRKAHMVFNVLIPCVAVVAITELSINIPSSLLFIAGGIALVKLCIKTKKKNDALAKENMKIKRMG